MIALIIVWIVIGAIGIVILWAIFGEIKGTTMKVSELAAALTALNTQVEKVRVEVQKLKDSLADVDLPVEAQQALDSLIASIKGVDDINPD